MINLDKLRDVRITKKISAAAFALMIITTILVNAITFFQLERQLKQTVFADQEKNFNAVAAILRREVPELTKSASGKLLFEGLPGFSSHETIDEIGSVTGETATIFIWDEESKDFWRRTTNIVKPDGKRAVGTPLGQNGRVYPYMMRGERYVGEATILGKDYYTLYEPVFSASDLSKPVGIVYVGMEKSQFVSKRNTLIFSILILTVILTLGSVYLLVEFLKKTITAPLDDVIAQMNRLSSGDKDMKITNSDREDEIGDIARALEVFQKNMQEIDRLEEDKKKTQEEQREQRRQQTLDMATNFESRIGGIVETVAAGIEELSASIDEITRNIQETAKMTEDCSSEAMTSRSKLSGLQASVQEIDTVVKSINDVAEQTNLLALNATIEAARAGEAGKGFAVVASEVKTLANETHKMTDEIVGKVEHIKRSSVETSDTVKNIIKKIDSVANDSDPDDKGKKVTCIRAAAESSAAAAEQIRISAKDMSSQASNLQSFVHDFINEIRNKA